MSDQYNPQQPNPYGQQPGQQQNPYGQQAPGQQQNPAQQNPYGQQQNPYGQQSTPSAPSASAPSASQPGSYGQAAQQNPYGQQAHGQQAAQANPYAQPAQQNPYGQQAPQQSQGYAQPAGYSQSQYGQAQQQNPYGQQAPGQQGAAQYNGYNNYGGQPQEKKSLHPLTLWAIILSGVGFLLSFIQGFGLPLSIAGIVLGAMAIKKDSSNKLWAILALAAGALGTIISIIIWIITIMIWP